MDEVERVLSRAVVAEDGCWLWVGAINSVTGYAEVMVDLQRWYVHRFVYTYFVGPIAPGLHVDHLCRVRACCNPDHLEAVTLAENNRRAVAVRQARLEGRSHCKRDHPVEGNAPCPICAAAAKQAWHERNYERKGNANARKTHCKRGHPLSGDNVRITTKGRRVCRTCHREHEARRPVT